MEMKNGEYPWENKSMEELLKQPMFQCLDEIYQLMDHKPLLYPMSENEVLNEVAYNLAWFLGYSRNGMMPDMERFKRNVYANIGIQEHAMTVFSLVYAAVSLMNPFALTLDSHINKELHKLNRDSWCGTFVELFVRDCRKKRIYYECLIEPLPVKHTPKARCAVQARKVAEACQREQVVQQRTTFSLEEIVADAVKFMTVESSQAIQNMLYRLLQESGTNEDREKVAAIPLGIMKREGRLQVGQSIHQQNNILDPQMAMEILKQYKQTE